MSTPAAQTADADRNWRRFVLFRVLFNSRFYYPVIAVMFLDLGLSATEYTLLNFAWALAIVFTDLPAGAMADRFGRKPLVLAAAVFMVLEMLLLCVAPYHGGIVLLLCCLANRILSGMAEGLASGADEALVFDSLAERGRSDEWPKVLDQVMRWQGVGMVIAMLLGGALYDPGVMTRALAFLGWEVHFAPGATIKFPVYLNLLTALLVLFIALGLREPLTHAALADSPGKLKASAWQIVVNAWTWITRTPVALFVIVAGVLLDSGVRLFLTFGSSYFRIIQIPEWTFGLIGASMGGIGLLTSPLAHRMVKANSVARNYAILGLLVLASSVGVACRFTWWGVLFIVPLAGAIMALGYIVSYYINALVDSSHRATVLSFKGLAFNLGYGFISLVFALVLRAVRDGGSTEEAVARGLVFLPVWVVIGGLICAFGFWRHRGLLAAKI